MREFPDVFPEELVTLPPEREVEFVVKLLSGAAPIVAARPEKQGACGDAHTGDRSITNPHTI